MFLDTDEEMTKEEIKRMIRDNLDSSGVSIENIDSELIEDI